MFNNDRQTKSLAATVMNLFGAQRCNVQVAALPWRIGHDGVEILLITSRDTGRWVLPKGWPEDGEHLCDAAAREAAEEAGVGGAVSATEIGVYHYAKQRTSGPDKPCRVHVFAMEIDRIMEKWPERRQRNRNWFSPPEAASLVREPDLAALIIGFGAQPRRLVAPVPLPAAAKKSSSVKAATRLALRPSV